MHDEEADALAALQGIPASNGTNGAIPSVSELASRPDLKNARRRRVVHADVAKADRLPPFSAEAEQGILGCVLMSPNECLGQCVEKLGEAGECFYDLRHQTIYEECVRMFDLRLPIDIITLQQCLKDRQLLDQIGGIPYLMALQDAVPSAANLSYYLDIVSEKHILRSLIHTCTDTVGRIYDHTGTVDELVDEVERDVFSITERRVQSGSSPIGDSVHGALETIESYSNGRGAPGAILTGFTDLDRMLLGGLKQAEMIVLAARPSMGKTSLLMNILENIAITNRIPVGLFSLEMTKEALTLRMVCSRARVSLRDMTEGFLRESDYPRLTVAAGAIRNAPIIIDDSPAISVLQLRSKARRMVQRHGIRAIGIDYLQLLQSLSKRAKENRQVEISEISSGIKALAKELGIPVIVLAQLNRDIEREKNRKPRLSDLRESGSIEQDADVVGLLYKPKLGDEEEPVQEEEADGIPVNLLIAKQRNGPTGDIHMTFLKPYTRFESAARVSDDDIPADANQRQQQFPD